LAYDLPDVEERLLAAWTAARREDVRFSAEEFVEHIAPHLSGADVAAALASLRGAELYLAGACAAGNRQALDAFERELGGEIGRAVRRSGSSIVRTDDVGQMLREKLFVAEPGRRPKIADYSGQGPLRVWLRIVLTRMVQNLSMRAPKESPLDGALLADLPASTGDPALDAMRETYRAEFRAAFTAAVGSLDVRDRILLRQRFSAQRTQEELALEYGVHVNTVARWLGRVRKVLEERTRDELRRRLRVEEGEFTSILRLVGSQLDLSLGTARDAAHPTAGES
jgi:RNA polymerase sigma-70 factor (ECF subfamily)